MSRPPHHDFYHTAGDADCRRGAARLSHGHSGELTPVQKLIQRSYESGRPYEVSWELTRSCPFDCRHCYIGEKTHDGELSVRDAKIVLDRIKRAGVVFLTFTGGEPTRHPFFYEIAEYARAQRFALRLFTAAGHLIDADIQRIAEIGFGKIDVSLMGIGQTHDRIVRREGAFDKACAAVEKLRRHGLRVHIKMTLLDDNIGDSDAVRRWAEAMGCSFQAGLFLGYRADINAAPDAAPPAHADAVRFLADQAKGDPESLAEKSLTETLLCGAGVFTWALAPNADVYPCTVFRLKCGNLLNDTFDTVFHSPEMTAVREMRLDELHDCLHCELAGFCTRCPGQSFMETGDFRLKNAEACREAAVQRDAYRRLISGDSQ